MARPGDALWELKESAKWSLDLNDRKKAIKLLASYGPEAIQSIAEIRDVSAYEEIRKVCIEAIKAAASQNKAPKPRRLEMKKSRRGRKSKRKK